MKARFLNGPLEGAILDLPFDEPVLCCAHYLGAAYPAEDDLKIFPQRFQNFEYYLVGIEFDTGIRVYTVLFPQKVRDMDSLVLTKDDESLLRQLHISSE